MGEFDDLTTEDYNNEPVYYCKQCLSLKIKVVGGFDFCDDCGNTNVGTAHVDEWDKLYQERYGEAFLESGDKDYYSKL